MFTGIIQLLTDYETDQTIVNALDKVETEQIKFYAAAWELLCYSFDASGVKRRVESVAAKSTVEVPMGTIRPLRLNISISRITAGMWFMKVMVLQSSICSPRKAT